MDKQVFAHKELLSKYENDITKGIMKQMDPKVIFKDVNFDDPLDLNEKKKKDSKNVTAPTIAPFYTFMELQRYLFLKPIEKNEETIYKA